MLSMVRKLHRRSPKTKRSGQEGTEILGYEFFLITVDIICTAVLLSSFKLLKSYSHAFQHIYEISRFC